LPSELLFLEQVLLAIGVGTLIGVEREYSKHQQIVGARTFALVSLLGALSVLVLQLSPNFAYLPYLFLLAVLGYAFILYYFRAKTRGELGITTMLSLPIAFLFGVFIGFGLYLQAIAGAIITTGLLVSRKYSHLFISHLTEEEIDDALLFGTILLIIYPLLPPGQVLIYNEFGVDLQAFFSVVILVSSISFVGFLLMRLLGQKALPLTGFFGGLINSVAVVDNFASRSKEQKSRLFLTGLATTSIAMLLRNLAITALLSISLFKLVFLPIAMMILAFIIFGALTFRSRAGKAVITFKQPFSVKHGIEFSVVLFIATILFYGVSQLNPVGLGLATFLAGLLSSASVVASVSFAWGAGRIGTIEGAYLIIIGCFASFVSKSFILLTKASKDFGNKGIPAILFAMLVGAITLILTIAST
jgi:uncharacterized membrane protein (DUF4010 family)